MTNEQLAVFLRGYATQLANVIDRLDTGLTKDLPRHELSDFFGDTKPGRLVCLDELVSLLERMQHDIHSLES